MGKVCSECGIEKPLAKFYVFHTEPDGHMAWCKACHNGLRELHRQQAAFFAERQLGDPSEEQIAIECRKFQARWSDKKRASMRSGKVPL